MTALNAAMPPLPDRFKRLPIDERGYPVPRFVAQIEGKWDFRCIRTGWVGHCYRTGACWLCGDRLGTRKAFVIGPMCAINRVTSEPPSHFDCARFAVMACPFMCFPNRKRDEHNLPKDKFIPGVHIDRNPGAFCLWVARSYKPFDAGDGSTLFRIEKPSYVEWWACGRQATRAEVLQSIESGYPLLKKAAARDGVEGLKELERGLIEAMKLVPPFVPEPNMAHA